MLQDIGKGLKFLTDGSIIGTFSFVHPGPPSVPYEDR